MLSNEDFTAFVEEVNSDNPSKRASMLRALQKFRLVDERVLPHLEYLLHDKSPCILGFPYIFGEVRWLAARALVAERTALGITEPVRLQNVVKPIDTAGIMKAEDAAELDGEGGVEGLLQSLGILRDMGYLPTYNLTLQPQPLASSEQKLALAKEGREQNGHYQPKKAFNDLALATI